MILRLTNRLSVCLKFFFFGSIQMPVSLTETLSLVSALNSV